MPVARSDHHRALLQEMVLLEIDVMNQLNHRNLVQLYDAIETPREIILFMEL